MAATAVLMGDIDLLRPLAMAEIPIAVFAEAGAAVRASRHATTRLPWRDPATRPDDAVDVLAAFARTQSEPPVIFPQTDEAVVAVSRNRDRLMPACRTSLASDELVEAFTDKARFAGFAERRGLPVPRTVRVDARPEPPELDLRYPVVLKPSTHQTRLRVGALPPKAVQVDSPARLGEVWPRIVAAGGTVLAQECIPGPETRIESYHSYVSPDGELVAEFTGRKIRTLPRTNGYSTAVELTRAPDVAALGRDIVLGLDVRGVAKFDFKRGPDGRLHLLEINPRFSLWHYLAARAGLNVPAVVYADLTGAPRPAIREPRPGAAWCAPITDALAARSHGVSPVAWMRWAHRCDALSGFSREDPLPFISSASWSPLRRLAAKY